MDCYKIKLNLSIDRDGIPYGYEMALHGYVSSIIGNDMYGERGKDYVYTNIIGIKPSGDHFEVEGEPYFMVRLSSEEQLSHFLKELPKRTEIFTGVTVKNISPCPDDVESGIFYSTPASPILLPKKYDSKDRLDKEDLVKCEQYLVGNAIRTANKFGFKLDGNFGIKILRQNKHSNYYYRGWMNKGRNLTVKINGNRDTINFVLSHGIGRGTGIGCGFLR